MIVLLDSASHRATMWLIVGGSGPQRPPTRRSSACGTGSHPHRQMSQPVPDPVRELLLPHDEREQHHRTREDDAPDHGRRRASHSLSRSG